MKTKMVEDLLGRINELDPEDPSDWDEFNEDELRWLKDHNRLPQRVEQAKFVAVLDGGDGLEPPEREYLGDVGTRFAGFAAGIPSGEDLSGLPPGERRRREIEMLQAQLDQLNAEEAALAAGEGEEQYDRIPEGLDAETYEEMTVPQLQAEVDRRNEEYVEDHGDAEGDAFQLPRPARKGELIAILREDDAAEDDEAEPAE